LARVVVILEDFEIIQLEAILLDSDKDAALEYLQNVLKQKMDLQEKAHCKPPF
jgi:hypothetical protein